jgi:hypothetical protein
MKSKVFALGLVVCLAAAAAFAADAFTGTWKLNEAKSKFAPGATKNSTVVYEATGDTVKVTLEGTSSDGKAVHSVWTGKFDGNDYPVAGNPLADTMAYKKIDDHTLHITGKKDGKVSLVAHVVISADGKTRTVTVTQTAPDGKKVDSTAVYDKQ